MSYQVLARKWRPRTFAELAGQGHVVKALENALTHGRLHHAYLLTGTRGVGKTTLARILAKSLNCETGVTAAPCGLCASCADIDGGRFVDLLELDAASNTGIDNMREILDNARYAPTVGRYKVYLIDEVHMLSKAAFNSMLKTLEEPPEHVKFVLATTDPQKIPVTVLSRCLQFNLKPLPVETIGQRLQAILAAEGIPADVLAVGRVARAAQGSMRDALSVLDQAIAHGGGELRDDAVRAMLGAVDGEHVYRILDDVAAADGAALVATARALSEEGAGLRSVLDDLAALLCRIAVAQSVPGAAEEQADGERVAAYATVLSPESVQLYYQIAIQSRADLALAPDELTGLTMALLRLVAFAPAAAISGAPRALAPSPSRPRDGPASRRPPTAATPARDALPPRSGEAAVPTRRDEGRTPSILSVAPTATTPESDASPAAPVALPAAPLAVPDRPGWPAFIADLRLSGITLQLAAQTELREVNGAELVLDIAEEVRHLSGKAYTDKLKAALEAALGRRLRVRVEIVPSTVHTLAARARGERASAKADTEASLLEDPFVQDVLSRFDARLNPDSIKPVS